MVFPQQSTHQTSKDSKNHDAKRKQDKMREELEELRQEYDIAAPARTASGHLRRRVPRTQWKSRTEKRKLLEKADEEATVAAFREQQEEAPQRRLRGSQKAFELIEESMVFPSGAAASQYDDEDESTSDEDVEEEDKAPFARKPASSEEEDGEDDADEDSNSEVDDADDNSAAAEDEDAEDNEEEDVEDVEGDFIDEEMDENVQEEEDASKPTKRKGTKRNQHIPKTKKRRIGPRNTHRRRMFRLRNFQSQKLAQRHGEALGAHARGQPLEAIRLLKEVAKKAPSAPQVYSSLGMVYQDLLLESRKRSNATAPPSASLEHQEESTDTNKSIPDALLAEQFELAKKTYGSYHIAAILYKKDYTLWTRAADAGIEIADILKRAIFLPNLKAEVVHYLSSERRRWQAETLRDLQSADGLKPPGIDVPCKLAAMHMEVGNLSEALTILTDLKNQEDPTKPGRGEFQSSYKAWTLYSDLMLRIGHECLQWNKGNRSNNNYMFRRWLRKYSESFDWQERRLQAFSLALEAAAGTSSTQIFLQWMRARASVARESSTAASITVPTGHDANEREGQEETERNILLARNKMEIEAFDQTTKDMDIDPDSTAAKDRQVSRDDMLKAQENAVSALDEEDIDTPVNGNQKTTNDQTQEEIVTEFHDILPIGASCRKVCKIASELMKHLHGLKLYKGARLVGDSIVRYLKLRAEKHDERRRAVKKFDEWHAKISQPSFLFEAYEDKSDDDYSVGGDHTPFLSDDEDLDDEENSQLLATFRSGVLPSELRVLYGLALMAEGGRNYLAGKCLEAIDELEQESADWLTSNEKEIDTSATPLWHLFQAAMTEPLGRTAAYAFLTDVLREAKKEREWSFYFSSWFRRHLTMLEKAGLKEHVLALREVSSPFGSYRKNQLLKIIIGSCSFDMEAVENPSQKSPVNYRDLVVIDDAERIKIAASTMKTLSEVLYLSWKVETDGSLPAMCADAVRVCSRCMCWLVKEASRVPYSQLCSFLKDSQTFLSFLCGDSVTLPDFKGEDEVEKLVERQWNDFPVESSWQAAEYRPLSLRTYNLIVACSVSLFSGWEPEEFTLQLLRRRHGHRHFGAHLRENRLAGCLNSSYEEEIGRQWFMVKELLPSFPDMKFDERLDTVKKSDWYQKEVADRAAKIDETEITQFAEDCGTKLFLAYSALCLKLASSERNPKVINRLLQSSLSVLLPVTQFCVDDKLWNSDIGEAATTLSGFDEWKLFNRVGIDAIREKEPKSKRRRKSEKVIEKKVQEWIKGTDKPILQSFVSLPLAEMRVAWFQDCKVASEEDKQTACELMENVHIATQKLRHCYTELACEKKSLNIAVSLLELASSPACYDPFRCLQQATMFATQASKAGNSDKSFRKKLPLKEECTPLEALVILGRADCLHSAFFPNEAAFLCSYVARICHMHRTNNGNSEDSQHTWDTRWKIVAIYAFNVSVMIRATVKNVLDKQQQKSFLSMWDRDVVAELERGRSDGWVWKRSLQNSTGGGFDTQEVNHEDFEAYEAENFVDDDDDDEDDGGDGSDDGGVADDGDEAEEEDGHKDDAMHDDVGVGGAATSTIAMDYTESLGMLPYPMEAPRLDAGMHFDTASLQNLHLPPEESNANGNENGGNEVSEIFPGVAVISI